MIKTNQATTETKAVKPNKEYLYNFTTGGWNTELATNKREAYKKACQRWEKESPKYVSQVDKKSFRIASEAEMKNLLSMFW
jgi:hypothetical protein